MVAQREGSVLAQGADLVLEGLLESLGTESLEPGFESLKELVLQDDSLDPNILDLRGQVVPDVGRGGQQLLHTVISYHTSAIHLTDGTSETHLGSVLDKFEHCEPGIPYQQSVQELLNLGGEGVESLILDPVGELLDVLHLPRTEVAKSLGDEGLQLSSCQRQLRFAQGAVSRNGAESLVNDVPHLDGEDVASEVKDHLLAHDEVDVHLTAGLQQVEELFLEPFCVESLLLALLEGLHVLVTEETYPLGIEGGLHHLLGVTGGLPYPRVSRGTCRTWRP